MAGRLTKWETATLGQLGGFRNGVNFSQEDYGVGFPIINVKQLYRGRFAETRNLLELRRSSIRNPENVQVKTGDILFARSSVKASGAGQVAMVGACQPGTVFSGFIIRLRIQALERADPSFLNYVLRSPLYRELLTRIGSGTTITNLSQDTLAGIEVELPPLSEQRAIVHVLSTIDDKIELNQRMNEALEATARTLFKSWFVDFDPVRAKAEGRDAGLPKRIVGLFPDTFHFVDRGEIPTGWQVRHIGDLATVNGGSTPSTKEESYWHGGTHCWVTPKDLSALKTPVLLDTERKITSAGLSQIASGLFPPGTVLMSSRAPIGYLAVAEIPVAINQGFIAMKAAAGVSNLFLLRWVEWAHDLIVSRANGSTFLEISKSNFRPIPVTTPPIELMNEFDRIVRPLYSRVVANELSSRTLTQLRDALMPKLISGELRLADTERILGAQN